MLAGARIRSINDMDEETEDFQRTGLVGRPKRRFARPVLSPSDRYDIQLRAAKVLKDAGFHEAEIAVAFGLTERSIRNKSRTLRNLAGLAGA